MALITLDQLKTLWQNVSDWATGVSATVPKVAVDDTLPNDIISVPEINALAIADTAWHISNPIDVSKAKNWAVVVRSTLNQAATLVINDGGMVSAGVSIARSGGTQTTFQINSASGVFVLTQSDHPAIGAPLTSIQIAVQCATTPTSGAITVAVVERRV